MSETIHILGGGPAGLATAYYAAKRHVPVRVYEADSEIGGNCRTLRRGAFLFDLGAHRLHDKDPEVTREIHSLLGDDLLLVEAPSSIVLEGRRLRFPPSVRDLLGGISPWRLPGIALEILFRKTPKTGFANFHDLAVGRYGRTLANLFLLNYTRKLWGRDPTNLSAKVAGGRLAGLGVSSLLRKKIFPGLLRPARTPHLDGTFFYPTHGIGSLFSAMAKTLPEGSIQVNNRVTRIRHNDSSILGITLNGNEDIPTARVVSTLPLPFFLRALDPPPPLHILEIIETIVFRNLVLCVLCLDQDQYSENASLYFPDPEVPFTRLYEPRNRSVFMAPQGSTCIVLEIPCDPADSVWNEPDDALIARLLPHLPEARHVLDAGVYRIPHAYPVLECSVESHSKELLDYCSRFSNLRLAGRNALFQYAHIHDMFQAGREAAES